MRDVQRQELYEMRWKELLASSTATIADDDLLRFEDVPWPIMTLSSHDSPVARAAALVEDFTADAISAFLFPATEPPMEDGLDTAKRRKEKLRETMLRYHPDKFEGRVMQRVRPVERDVVKEAVGIVARTLNALMAQTK